MGIPLDAYIDMVNKLVDSDELKERLINAYQIGYLAGKEDGMRPVLSWKNLSLKVLDFGLPSRTKWVRPENQGRESVLSRFSALQMGLQLPTKAQCEELSKCIFSFDQYDGRYHQHIKGPNGIEHGLFYGWTYDIPFYLWPSDGYVNNETLQTEAYILTGQYPPLLEKTTINMSETGFSLFILSDEMKGQL